MQVDGITDAQVARAKAELDRLLKAEEQISTAVALAFVAVVMMCPDANPSDLWQHVIYRHLLKRGWNDNRWKRVSGFALERALVALYGPRLAAHGLRMRILDAREANAFLATLETDVQATKVDLFLEGEIKSAWRIFGAAHVKSSIAERIQDDVPASRVFMEHGLTSIMLTMDSKSYPPPHGNCINYGELGGRSLTVAKERLKRGYIENAGQFDGLFSFNLRTPPSPAKTPSGKRIYAMSFSEKQPDKLVRFVIERWGTYLKGKVG
ncbi:MAG: BsaWI family type II restriction enzyme [Candidatus Binatus sp.]